MRSFSATIFLSVLLAISFGCNTASQNPETATKASTDPDQLLRQMSQQLGSAALLSFKASRKLDVGLIEGRDLPEESQILVSVARPGKLVAKSSSDEGVRYLYADGKNVTLFDETMKLYATVPLQGSIDDLATALDERYGFTPPLIEFLVSDSYQRLSQQIQRSSFKGQENVNGVECYRISIVGKFADSELWIATKDLLPYKLIATFKDRENHPQLAVQFSDWNLKPQLEEKLFTFEPPSDAEKIAMVSTEEMKQAAAKDAKEQQ